MKISKIQNYKYYVNNRPEKQNINFTASSIFNYPYSEVDKYLYRGRIPEGINELKELKNIGISRIINFASDTKYDPKTVEELGMKYYDLYFVGYPKNNIIDSFFNIVKEVTENSEKMYVHCFYGIHRTGLMVNLYKLNNKIPIIENNSISKMAQTVFKLYKSCNPKI